MFSVKNFGLKSGQSRWVGLKNNNLLDNLVHYCLSIFGNKILKLPGALKLNLRTYSNLYFMPTLIIRIFVFDFSSKKFFFDKSVYK